MSCAEGKELGANEKGAFKESSVLALYDTDTNEIVHEYVRTTQVEEDGTCELRKKK